MKKRSVLVLKSIHSLAFSLTEHFETKNLQKNGRRQHVKCGIDKSQIGGYKIIYSYVNATNTVTTTHIN